MITNPPEQRRSDFVNLTGMKFGAWTVLRWSHQHTMPCGQRPDYWLCRCDCGQERAVRGGALVGGINTRCRSCAIKKVSSLLRNKSRRHVGKKRFAVTITSLRKHGSAGERPQFNARCDCGTSFVTHGLQARDCGCGMGHAVPSIEAVGQRKTASEWARILGVSRQRVHQMKVRGDLVEQITRRLS